MFGRTAADPNVAAIRALLGGGAPVSFDMPQTRYANAPKPRGGPSLKAPKRSIGQKIEDGLGEGLRAVGVQPHNASRFANKAFGAFNDLTPVGNVTGAQEGYGLLKQGITKGDVTTGAVGLGSLLLSILPGAQGAKKPLKSLLTDNAGAIRAWHGSPHDFDRFDMSKIGTGEGAQAYGHGLYFAENPAVAKEYRDNLRYAHKRYEIDGKPPEEFGFSAKDPILSSAANGRLPQFRETWENWPRDNAAKVALADRNLAHLKAIEGRTVRQITPDGRLYEVNINAEPEDFLDWDAPLVNQPRALEALKAVDLSVLPEGNRTRVLLERAGTAAEQAHYPATGHHLYGAAADYGERSVKGSQLLREQGFPGIRYLDQGSRGAGNGSRNFVVFDDKLVDILGKY
jgi:hypothetical protein